MRESGGNPNAINLTDSNAQAGHPSQGLMQTIPSTFAAYHQAGTSNSITDPVANIAAGINYIKARYGGIGNVQQANPNASPKGYDAGGYLSPGMTLAINRTGRPERILDANQTAKFDAAMQGGGLDSSVIGDKLDAVKQLLEKNGAGAVINVHDSSGDPTETARRTVLALRM
jgi:SLT domain-containing protein